MSSILALEILAWALTLPYALAPGWLLCLWLFPKESLAWKMAAGAGMSIGLLGLIALVLSFLPTGITYDTLMVTIGVLNLLAAIPLLVARSHLVEKLYRFVFAAKIPGRNGWMPYFSVMLIALILAAFLGLVPIVSRVQKESYTEFYIADAFLHAPPWRRQVGAVDTVPLTIVVASSEQDAAMFQVQVTTDGQIIGVIDLGTLQPGERVQTTVHIPSRLRSEQLYVLTLYKDNWETPYRTLHFWLYSPVDQGDSPTL